MSNAMNLPGAIQQLWRGRSKKQPNGQKKITHQEVSAQPPRLTLKQRWHKSWRFKLDHMTRWLFISVLFWFFLGMIVALYETLGFQRRIAHLVNNDDDRVRRILVVLYNELETGRLTAHTTAYGAMVVKLDGLEQAARALAKFQGFEDKKNGSDESDEAKERRRVLQAEYRELKDSLRRQLSDLKSLVTDHTPGMPVVTQFNVFESRLKELVKLKISFNNNENENNPKGLVVHNALAQPPLMHQATLEYSQKLLDDTKKAVLEAFQELSISPTRMQAIDEKLSALNMQSIRLADYKKVAVASTEDTDQSTAAKDPKDSNDLDKRHQQVLRDIESTAAELEQVLIEYNDEMRIARRIAGPVTSLQVATHELESINPHPDNFKYVNGENEQTGSNATARYGEAVSDLKAAIQDLENILVNFTSTSAIAQVLGDDPSRREKAETILMDFQTLQRFNYLFMPFDFLQGSWLDFSNASLHPQRLATLNSDSLALMFVFIIGAIGSLLYITKYKLQRALQGQKFSDAPQRPLVWMIFRPIFGVIVVMAIFLLVKAGQFALGNGDSSAFDGGLNLPVFGVIALFAGLLSWQALDAIETRGSAWFRTQRRTNLWATGLANALLNAGKTDTECAAHIGRSVEQIRRWIMFQDRVTPEIQDRISTWLERPIEELFHEIKPAQAAEQKSLWASGLAGVLEGKGMDDKGLAELLGEDLERVCSWINLHLQVTPPVQWRLVAILNVPHIELFTPSSQNEDRYALNLRAVLKQNARNASWLADELERPVEQILQWIELDEPVPYSAQVRIAEKLSFNIEELFSPSRPKDDEFRWLRDLRSHFNDNTDERWSCERLAKEADVSLVRVRDWMELEKKVAPATQRRLSELLSVDREKLFIKKRPASGKFLLATGLKAVLAQQSMSAEDLANKLDVDEARVHDWIEQSKRVPPATQTAIEKILNTEPDIVLFTAVEAASDSAA